TDPQRREEQRELHAVRFARPGSLMTQRSPGSGAVVAHQLWELAVGGSNPPSPTRPASTCERPRRARARADGEARAPAQAHPWAPTDAGMDAQRGRVEVVVHGPCEAVDLQRDVEDETGKTDWSNNSLRSEERRVGKEDQQRGSE